MSFIQIAYTEDRTTSRLTTGKVLVSDREKNIIQWIELNISGYRMFVSVIKN